MESFLTSSISRFKNIQLNVYRLLYISKLANLKIKLYLNCALKIAGSLCMQGKIICLQDLYAALLSSTSLFLLPLSHSQNYLNVSEVEKQGHIDTELQSTIMD